jgi:hypothetical protein
MTSNGRPRAHWTNAAHWTDESQPVIALPAAFAHEPRQEFEVLLDPAAARRLVMVLTRLLMELDQDPPPTA